MKKKLFNAKSTNFNIVKLMGRKKYFIKLKWKIYFILLIYPIEKKNFFLNQNLNKHTST